MWVVCRVRACIGEVVSPAHVFPNGCFVLPFSLALLAPLLICFVNVQKRYNTYQKSREGKLVSESPYYFFFPPVGKLSLGIGFKKSLKQGEKKVRRFKTFSFIFFFYYAGRIGDALC